MKRKIEVPEGLACSDCGSTDLTGRGTDWRKNPNGNEPPRIKVQLFRCKSCGKIIADGEVKNDTEEKQ